MPTKTKVPRGTTRHPDPEGDAWLAEAGRRWGAATNRARRAGGDFTPAEFFTAPAFPTWSAPAHVTRELLGRYLHDRDTNIVHDTAHALEACGIDGIHNATFVHFRSELERALPADVVDCACMGGAS